MLGHVPPWALAERGPTTRNELLRKVKRRWRRVPDLAALREAGMAIGRNVSAMNNVHLDPGRPWLLSIGDDVVISFNVSVLTHDASTLLQTGYTRLAPVSIGSRVFIGAHAVVLPGVTIGDDVVVGAGSVVSRDVPSGSIVAGSPARVLGSMEDWRAEEMARIGRSPRWTPDGLPVEVGPGQPPPGSSAEELRAAGGQGYVGKERLQDDPRAVQRIVAEQAHPTHAGPSGD